MALKFRRGTTAQKSGSLAVGEPYINYDLQTLQIGTDQGDVTLSTTSPTATSAVASISASNFVSASYLHIVNDANIKGNVTIGGTIQIGDQTSDVVNVVASLSSSLIPVEDNTFDLGSINKAWKDLYISTGSIKMVSNGVVVSTLSNTGNGFQLDQGIIANGDSTFGTSSAAVTSVTGSLRVSGSTSVIGALSASTLTGVGNVTSYSSSVASRLAAVESFSASLDNTFATDAQLSSVSGAFATSLSASNAEHTSFSASAATALTSLSSSVKAVTDTFATSASVATATANSISSLSSSVKAVTDTFATSASVATATANSISTLSASIATTDATQTTNITSNSASAAGAFASASAYSASAATTYALLNGNNVFTGTQTITGSLYVSANLVVQGSSSLQNITASAASIGTNTVILNTSTPSVRFGGLAVQDSGSGAGASGSLLWDSVNDVWLYQQPTGAPEGYGSARLISGPKNSGSLGNETGLTVGQVPVAVGDDHIGDSIISASVSKVTIAGALDVTGNVSASSVSGIGNVTSYSTSVDSRIATIETTYATSASIASATANSISSLSSSVKAVTDTFATSASVASATANSISSLSSSVAASGFAVSSSVATATANSISSLSASITTTVNSVSSSIPSVAKNSLSALNASGIYYTASSGQFNLAGIPNASLTNSSVTINGTSLSLGGTLTTAQTLAGAISSSGQVDLTATTNYGTYINQAVKTTSSPTFAGLTINGSITATGDITAYYTSDKRFKDNVQTIPNALDKVKALNGVTWDWAEGVSDVTKAAPTTGLIAQEVQAVLPQVVKEKEDGFLGLDYSKMIGLLVEAIKEQQYKIDTLHAELEHIKNTNNQ